MHKAEINVLIIVCRIMWMSLWLVRENECERHSCYEENTFCPSNSLLGHGMQNKMFASNTDRFVWLMKGFECHEHLLLKGVKRIKNQKNFTLQRPHTYEFVDLQLCFTHEARYAGEDCSRSLSLLTTITVNQMLRQIIKFQCCQTIKIFNRD